MKVLQRDKNTARSLPALGLLSHDLTLASLSLVGTFRKYLSRFTFTTSKGNRILVESTVPPSSCPKMIHFGYNRIQWIISASFMLDSPEKSLSFMIFHEEFISEVKSVPKWRLLVLCSWNFGTKLEPCPCYISLCSES